VRSSRKEKLAMTSAESLVIHTTAQTTREDTKQEDLEVGNLKCSATIDELVTLMEFRGLSFLLFLSLNFQIIFLRRGSEKAS
jgi:hypothetical protein